MTKVDIENDHDEIAKAVDQICKDFTPDYWRQRDDSHTFPHEFYKAMADAGWVGLPFPEEFGGGGGGIADAVVVMRTIAASGAAMNGCTPLHLTMFSLQPVVKFGSRRLQETFLPPAIAGDLHVAFGVTEPDAGTDTSRIRTAARRDDDGWIVKGQKIWTSKAMESQHVLLLCRTSEPTDDRFGGLSLLLADLDPKYVTIRPIDKLGRNAVSSCETFYDDLPVEGWRLVGQEGKGFRHLLAAVNAERLLLAAEAVGIGEAALKAAVEHARTREVFGRPIGTNQAISHPLAQAHAQLQAAWTMVVAAARELDAGRPDGGAINAAKWLAAEAGFFAADRAVQTLGGLGYAREYHVERYFREARLMRLAPVSQEMALNFIAHNVLRLPRSY